MRREVSRPVSKQGPPIDDKVKVEFVRLLEEFGPKINKIARRLGLHKETARYWYHQKIVGNGFVVQAVPDYGRLGLTRIVAVVKVNPGFKPIAPRIFEKMAHESFLSYFARTLGEDTVLIHASVPSELTGEFKQLLGDLRDTLHIFTKVEVLPFETYGWLPMKAQFYDFDHDRWDLDWNAVKHFRTEGKVPSGSAREKHDHADLVIIGNLQVSAATRLASVAPSLGLSYKRTLSHYDHLRRRGLISRFRILWTGTTYIQSERRANVSKHRYVITTIIVRRTSKEETHALVEGLEGIPFAWAEGTGKNFIFDLVIPMDLLNEVLRHVRDVLGSLDERASIFFVDQNEALAYTVPDENYDPKREEWVLDRARVIGSFRRFIAAEKRAPRSPVPSRRPKTK